MIVAGLDGHWQTTAPLMHSSCNDGMIQLNPLSSYAVLEVVETSHAICTPSLAVCAIGLHCSQLDLDPANLEATVKARMNSGVSVLAKTALFNDVTITPSLRSVVQVLMGHFYNFSLTRLSGWFLPKIMKSCLNLSKLQPKYCRSLFLSGHGVDIHNNSDRCNNYTATTMKADVSLPLIILLNNTKYAVMLKQAWFFTTADNVWKELSKQVALMQPDILLIIHKSQTYINKSQHIP